MRNNRRGHDAAVDLSQYRLRIWTNSSVSNVPCPWPAVCLIWWLGEMSGSSMHGPCRLSQISDPIFSSQFIGKHPRDPVPSIFSRLSGNLKIAQRIFLPRPSNVAPGRTVRYSTRYRRFVLVCCLYSDQLPIALYHLHCTWDFLDLPVKNERNGVSRGTEGKCGKNPKIEKPNPHNER